MVERRSMYVLKSLLGMEIADISSSTQSITNTVNYRNS